MTGTLHTPEKYEADIAVLEKHAGELERQLARFRRAESRWQERKIRLRNELRQRMKEIDFLYMLLLQQNVSPMEGSAANEVQAVHAEFFGN